MSNQRELMQPIDNTVSLEAIRKAMGHEWPQYDGATVQYESMALGSLKSLIPLVKRERFDRNRSLLQAYEDNDIPAYFTTEIETQDGKEIVLSPFIERSEHGLLIVDGVHRLLAAHQAGYDEAIVAVVEPQVHVPAYASADIPLVDVQPSTDEKTNQALLAGLRQDPRFRPGAKIGTHARTILSGRRI